MELGRALARPTRAAARSLDRRDGVDHRLQQHRVVGVAADSHTAKGMPPRSTSRWYLLPGLPRSVGFGPVSQPPLGAHADRVEAGAGPVESAVVAQLVQEQVVELLPDAGAPTPVPT
jgi:hypothetical protein